jgi:hypothetical protein
MILPPQSMSSVSKYVLVDDSSGQIGTLYGLCSKQDISYVGMMTA